MKMHVQKIAIKTAGTTQSNRVVLLLFGAALFLLNACASTAITGSWKDPDFKGRINKVMIIGVAKDPVLRKIYETDFAREIQAHGAEGIPSYTLFPTNGELSQEAVQAKARELNIDSIIVTKLLKHRKERERVTDVSGPPPTASPYYGGYPHYGGRPYYGNWYGDYSSNFRTVRSYTVEYNVVDLETSVYDLKSGKPVWSVISQTTIQEASQKEINSVIDTVVKQMVKDGLL
jgi:hypothetical protein